jgi:hypothetical protein
MPEWRARTEHAIDKGFGASDQLRERDWSPLTWNLVRLAFAGWRMDDDGAFPSAAVAQFKLIGAVLKERNHKEAAHHVAPLLSGWPCPEGRAVEQCSQARRGKTFDRAVSKTRRSQL